MSMKIISKIRSFHLLPESVQSRIISLLVSEDFSAAKEIYDLWFAEKFNEESLRSKKGKDSSCEN